MMEVATHRCALRGSVLVLQLNLSFFSFHPWLPDLHLHHLNVCLGGLNDIQNHSNFVSFTPFKLFFSVFDCLDGSTV
jgi:hypothetical protein